MKNIEDGKSHCLHVILFTLKKNAAVYRAKLQIVRNLPDGQFLQIFEQIWP